MDEIAKRVSVRKFVITGSASSIVGPNPIGDGKFVYDSPLKWTNIGEVDRPNDKAKMLGERYCWNKLTEYEDDTFLKMAAILPYFMTGPPLYSGVATSNSSCLFISDLIYNKVQVYP